MRKGCIMFVLLLLCCLTACGSASESGAVSDVDSGSIIAEIIAGNDEGMSGSSASQEETEMDVENRAIVAKALGLEENDRKIHFLLKSLEAANVGQIEKVELGEEDGERILDVLSQNHTEYRIYLSSGNSVTAIHNLSTDEWPVTSVS